MSSTSSKNSRNRRSSILKVRQTTVETAVDVAEQQKNRRRVSFHHQKTVKEYDKEKHELSATSPMKEALKEAMSDFDSTKSNSTFMSLGTPDRTTGDNNTMMLFRGMMSGGQPSSVHRETKDMSFSIIEDPANAADQNDTLNVFNGISGGHMSIHSKTIDISYRMEESVNENPADNTMDVFGNQTTRSARIISNTTLDMDISKIDNTLTTGGFEGDDTMAVFGGGSAKNDTTIPLDDTMNVFTAVGARGDKSVLSQSILMDMTAIPTPVSSQDATMAVFGSGNAKNDTTIPLDDTMNVFTADEKEESEQMEMDGENEEIQMGVESMVSSPSPIASNTPLAATVTGMMSGGQPSPIILETRDKSSSIIEDPANSADQNDTLNVFNGMTEGHMSILSKTVDMSHRMEESVNENPADDTMNVFRNHTTQPTRTLSNTSLNMDISRINNTLTAGDFEREDTMAVFGSGSESAKNDTTIPIEDTMNVFQVDPKEDSEQMEMDEEKSVRVEEESPSNEEEKKVESPSSIHSGGDASQMDLSGEGNDTLGIFGKKDEKEKKDETVGEVKEDEEEKIIDKSSTSFTNQSIVEDPIPEEKEVNESVAMEDDSPLPSQSPLYDANRRKTRLSTVIEVSSGYTAASSQSMRHRVESTEEEEKEEGILDRMDDTVDEKEESKQMEMDGEKSVRVEEESMISSPSPTDNNTTFSATLTKRNMLDETRLSDRSMMNITRTFDEIMLEKVDWMRIESEEGGEMKEILRNQAIPFREELNQVIERSEGAVEGLLSEITQLKHGDLLSNSIMKMNATKVSEYRYLFEWARREAQREWWEKRGEKGETMNEEMKRSMEKDEDELSKAKDDFIMMSKFDDLREDVESMTKEVEMGKGLNKNTVGELIGASKKKEEEKERLQREVNRMEMENMKQSTNMLELLIERSRRVDESIKKKMEEREKNKRELRAYISQLTNNLK